MSHRDLSLMLGFILELAPNAYLSNLASILNIWRAPPFHAFRAAIALPSADLGPVDFSHGRHCLISSPCRTRRSTVHPFAMLALQ